MPSHPALEILRRLTETLQDLGALVQTPVRTWGRAPLRSRGRSRSTRNEKVDSAAREGRVISTPMVSPSTTGDHRVCGSPRFQARFARVTTGKRRPASAPKKRSSPPEGRSTRIPMRMSVAPGEVTDIAAARDAATERRSTRAATTGRPDTAPASRDGMPPRPAPARTPASRARSGMPAAMQCGARSGGRWCRASACAPPPGTASGRSGLIAPSFGGMAPSTRVPADAFAPPALSRTKASIVIRACIAGAASGPPGVQL